VGITGQGMKDQDGIGFGVVEFPERLICQSNVGKSVSVLCGEGPHLTEGARTQVIAISPRPVTGGVPRSVDCIASETKAEGSDSAGDCQSMVELFFPT